MNGLHYRSIYIIAFGMQFKSITELENYEL